MREDQWLSPFLNDQNRGRKILFENNILSGQTVHFHFIKGLEPDHQLFLTSRGDHLELRAIPFSQKLWWYKK